MAFDEMPICANCAYSDDDASPVEASDGEWILCRRRAPVVRTEADDGYVGGPGLFPRVDRDDWCGEWVQSCMNTRQRKQRDFLTQELELMSG